MTGTPRDPDSDQPCPYLTRLDILQEPLEAAATSGAMLREWSRAHRTI